MCDYCGCRSMPVIADLGDEHDRILVLAGTLRRALEAGDHGAATAALEELRALLAVHHEVEEASILPALAAEGLATPVAIQEAEHETTIRAIAALPDALDPSLPRLLDGLDDHIAREEYDLFPAALLAIAPADWDAVEERAAAARSRAG